MRTLSKLCIVVLLLLFVLTGCDLYNQVNVGWSIISITGPGSIAHVTYTVQNLGKYDLTGVNLHIGVYIPALPGYISAWTTPDFSLTQGELKTGSIDINISPYNVIGDVTGAEVLGVDMDNPQD